MNEGAGWLLEIVKIGAIAYIRMLQAMVSPPWTMSTEFNTWLTGVAGFGVLVILIFIDLYCAVGSLQLVVTDDHYI